VRQAADGLEDQRRLGEARLLGAPSGELPRGQVPDGRHRENPGDPDVGRVLEDLPELHHDVLLELGKEVGGVPGRGVDVGEGQKVRQALVVEVGRDVVVPLDGVLVQPLRER